MLCYFLTQSICMQCNSLVSRGLLSLKIFSQPLKTQLNFQEIILLICICQFTCTTLCYSVCCISIVRPKQLIASTCNQVVFYLLVLVLLSPMPDNLMRMHAFYLTQSGAFCLHSRLNRSVFNKNSTYYSAKSTYNSNKGFHFTHSSNNSNDYSTFIFD